MSMLCRAKGKRLPAILSAVAAEEGQRNVWERNKERVLGSHSPAHHSSAVFPSLYARGLMHSTPNPVGTSVILREREASRSAAGPPPLFSSMEKRLGQPPKIKPSRTQSH